MGHNDALNADKVRYFQRGKYRERHCSAHNCGTRGKGNNVFDPRLDTFWIEIGMRIDRKGQLSVDMGSAGRLRDREFPIFNERSS